MGVSMIIQHQTIDLYERPLFTLVKVKTPMTVAVPLPSEACFAYIIDGDNQSLSERPELKAEPGKVILSLCGHTVGHMISEQEAGQLDSVIVHFHKEQLMRVYEDSKPPMWKELEAPVTQYVVQTAASELVRRYFEGLIHLFQHKEAVTEDILILKLKEIILLLLQTKDSPQITQIICSLFSERTFSFKEVIESHICLPVTIEDLAHLTNRSLSSFKREFKKIYNSSPATYIIDRRTEKVAELLKVSDDSISGIGYQCGFSSPAHLSRVFKEKFGLSPSEYRMTPSDKQSTISGKLN